jgi:hypothetical protein
LKVGGMDSIKHLGIGFERYVLKLVACLGTKDRWPANEARVHLLEGIAVRVVEASAKTAHDFEMGFLFCGVDYSL